MFNIARTISCIRAVSQGAVMSQRIITSFFRAAPVPSATPATPAASATPAAALSSAADSPPLPSKNRKRQRIDSDDSDTNNTAPSSPARDKLHKTNSSPSKTENVSRTSSTADTCDVLTDKDGNVQHVAPERYAPDSARYCPVRDACWSRDEAVPYAALARTLAAVEATSARLRSVTILSNLLRSVIALTPADLLPALHLCLNRVAAPQHALELGVAETCLLKALAGATGRTLAQVKAEAARAGDLGAVAAAARASQRLMRQPRPLTLRQVHADLKELALLSGHASMTKKVSKIQSMFVSCRDVEAKYLIRSLAGKLRVGLAEQSVLAALSQAVALTPPAAHPPVLDASANLTQDALKELMEETALSVRSAYCECPDLELLLPPLLQHGAMALSAHVRLTPGVPLKPMLAQPTRGVREVLTRFEGVPFTCEWKYDGERAQIHVPSDATGAADFARAAVFSRNQENNTTKYPDVLRRLPAALAPDVTSCVLDCEVVAYDVDNALILPFQVLSTRKRKAAVEAEIKVQVCVFMFDLLYLNGESLVRSSLEDRRRLLRAHFREEAGRWQFATARDCGSVDALQECLEEAVRGRCEGLMVKTLHGDRAHYEIARRSRNWLKLKKDYVEGAGDSVDAVVIGAYAGRGRRTGAYGGFLLACYEPESERFQSLCKLGTGFSDEDLARLTRTLQPHVLPAPRPYYAYDPAHAPDVWLAPVAVWEVRCADLSLSPHHRAAIGLVESDRGISLRFPRFVREREDKSAEQATSAQQVADMYLGQELVQDQPHAHHDMFY